MSEDSDENLCKGCYEEQGRFTCVACKKVTYCGKQCQEKDWCYHIFDCNTDKPIRTYHYLARAIRKDLLPTDGPTKEAWGFYRAEACTETPLNQNYLFGVYEGLVKYRGIEPKTLDQWRRKGTLLQEIKRVYEAIPEQYRGEYYPWLLRNEYILDRSRPLPSSDGGVSQILQTAWSFTKGDPGLSDEQIQARIDSWPPKKRDCFLHCGMAIIGMHPGPEMSLWVTFGYGIGDQYTEMCVSRRYNSLLESVSFQEFHEAYESSTMMELLRLKGLSWNTWEEFKEEFEDVMSSSGRGVYKSVWWLKAFVQRQVEKVTPDFNVEPSVRADYGFMNCRNDTDRRTLLQLYRQYFESENPAPKPLDLHKACLAGQLFEHLTKFPRVKLKEEHRRLLKNIYPLAFPDT